ncbi:MAG: UDP-N-acetylglucosamine--N-acetylmuramyl-(pentapeptide) pyrophosphoryl-undecaprenol N-acetylglucosamine transferase [Planctomycetes bacterium]|nr:UDP-N-acetylglucosamine--N-acetylmuramyl-(pentapeptide) pyrophosphoryl-undecaprenol N-acetylglucosamine transferase [Planctomycetota bacterium]
MALIAVATGGTGGHVYAAVAVAEAFCRFGHDVYIIYPSGDRSERFLGEENAHARFVLGVLPPIVRSGLRNSAVSFFNQVKGTRELFAERPPDALVVVGSYAVVGPGIAALLDRIPVIVYEQNGVAGRANRALSHFARRILVNIPAERLSSRQVVVGHPVRERLLLAAGDSAFRRRPPLMLVVGGSQGARSLDRAFMRLYPLIGERFPHWGIMHVTGPDLYDEALNAYRSIWGEPSPPAGVFTFRNDIENLYALASAAVSRAGAMASAELALFGIPTVFVPYPHAAANHQQANAAHYARNGAAIMVTEGACFRERLWGGVINLLARPVFEAVTRRLASESVGADGVPMVHAVLSALSTGGR